MPTTDERFVNRERSWLEFNSRVLALAEDPAMPLLDRLKFMAIVAGNFDEFFMVRVAGLQRRDAAGLGGRSADGQSAREQLELIAQMAGTLAVRHAELFGQVLTPALAAAGVRLATWDGLTRAAQRRLHVYFREHVFPVLTPLAHDPSHPFPYISGLSLNLAVIVRDHASGSEHFARVKVPDNLPRFVPCGQDAFLPVEELLRVHLDQLFPGLEICESHAFRVTRNAEVELEEEEEEDLLQALERELARRRLGPAVRLEISDSASTRVLTLLMQELQLRTRDVYKLPGMLDLTSLWSLVGLDRPDLASEPHSPVTHPRLQSDEQRDIFSMIREGDILVHHPYQAFATSVQRLIEDAAADPDVMAVKQTLYRTSGDSPIVEALIDAAKSGKQVVVLVEIKARFDEQANITWARKLEQAGCHVVYGVVGLKTHCKVALVVRNEGGSLRTYAHVGTGNYNPRTARQYEDIGLLTADPEVGEELTLLFNSLTGYTRRREHKRLLVAPDHVRSGIVARINEQAVRASMGMPSRISLKVNSLADEEVATALYAASSAGVPVDCVVRGICILRPGVPGLSENIRVRSVLGRFLEHSRVMVFGPDEDCEMWIGSADIMHRNLDRRVEVLIRVDHEDGRRHLRWYLDELMSPTTDAWDLRSDGSWVRSRDAYPGVTDVQERMALRLGIAAEHASLA